MRLGARKASEIVIWTWRLLQASRVAMSSMVAVPASISDSHRRARDCGDELGPGIGADRTGHDLGCAVGNDDISMSSVRRLAPRHGKNECVSAVCGLIFAQ
jgi:hypothetical protein